eukprot:GHVT01043905.1.p1 GENE.GHVT01043905.1~~GHVT01043905.1.p1  ORF type:complete len:146 (+),score=12.48 GHVT01043905.1:359-796(+)
MAAASPPHLARAGMVCIRLSGLPRHYTCAFPCSSFARRLASSSLPRIFAAPSSPRLGTLSRRHAFESAIHPRCSLGKVHLRYLSSPSAPSRNVEVAWNPRNLSGLCFEINDYAGSLIEALTPFKVHHITLTRIQSRPSPLNMFKQ